MTALMAFTFNTREYKDEMIYCTETVFYSLYRRDFTSFQLYMEKI